MSDQMTAERLEEIEAREQKAAAGPWLMRMPPGSVFPQVVRNNPGAHNGQSPITSTFTGTDDPSDEGTPARRANAEFVAHARQDVPALLAYVRLLEGLASDRALDSDLAQWAARQERGRIAEAMGVEVGVLDVSLAVIKSRVTIAPAASVSTKATEVAS